MLCSIRRKSKKTSVIGVNNESSDDAIIGSVVLESTVIE